MKLNLYVLFCHGCIKYFENSSKNMSFFIKDDDVSDKYNEISNKIKEKINIKNKTDKKYIKAKQREYDRVIKTSFLGNKVRKENIPYTCIACLMIDSVVRMDKKKLSADLFRRIQI